MATQQYRSVMDRYLRRKRDQLGSYAGRESSLNLTVEPLSAQDAVKGTIRAEAILEAEDPLNMKVVCTVQAEPSASCLQRADLLRSVGVDPTQFLRSGGLYQTEIAAKKLRKQLNYTDFLYNNAERIYEMPWFTSARQRVISLLNTYKERTLYNIQVALGNPELLLVGKPAKTGTGYVHPWSTREDMAKNFTSLAPHATIICRKYYDDMISAVQKWPQEASEILVPWPFRGIRGSRSDADVLECSPDFTFQRIQTITREVTNDPSSPFHNKGLDPAKWQYELFNSISSEYHIIPQDIMGQS